MIINDLIIIFKGKEGHVENIEYKTSPLVIRAIGSVSKQFLRTLGDYIPKAWSKEDGCVSCWDEMIKLQEKKVQDHLKLLFNFYRKILQF